MRWAAPCVVLLILGGTAHAQVRDRAAISVERWTPAPGPGRFGIVEEPDVLPAHAWALSAWTSYAARPIVFRDASGAAVSDGVRQRLGVELGGAVGLGTRYQLGVAVPLVFQDGNRLRGTGLPDTHDLRRAEFGDVRLHLRVRVAGDPGAPGLGAALAATVVLPTGDAYDFAGEAGTVVEWRVLVGWRNHVVALAANLGVRIRHDEVILLGQPNGDEVTAAAAATAAVPYTSRRAWAVAEIASVLGDRLGGVRAPSPAEARLGAHVAVARGWDVAAFGGLGISADVGAPAWRGVIGASWTP